MRHFVALSIVVTGVAALAGCGSSTSTPDDATMRKVMSGPPMPPMAQRMQGHPGAPGAAMANSPKGAKGGADK